MTTIFTWVHSHPANTRGRRLGQAKPAWPEADLMRAATLLRRRAHIMDIRRSTLECAARLRTFPAKAAFPINRANAPAFRPG